MSKCFSNFYVRKYRIVVRLLRKYLIAPLAFILSICICIYLLHFVLSFIWDLWGKVNDNDKLGVLATCITAVSTFFAFFFALKAFNESRKLRKTEAFSEMFTQLMSNHRDIFDEKCLKK